jgi:hypothetical protein
MTQPTPPDALPPGHYDSGHIMLPVDWHNVQRDREEWLKNHSGNHLSGPAQ